MVTLLLVDDQVLFLEGLRALLAQQPDLRIVAVAGDGQRALDLAIEHRPAVIVMDVSMPGLNGIDTAERLREKVPDSRVLALSMHAEPALARRMLDAGARGYALKDDGFHPLLEAIRRVHAGGTYLSPALDAALRGTDLSALRPLSPREREVLRLIGAGRGASEIAVRLNISVKTVESHRERIRDKLGIDTTAGLIKFAIREGLTDL